IFARYFPYTVFGGFLFTALRWLVKSCKLAYFFYVLIVTLVAYLTWKFSVSLFQYLQNLSMKRYSHNLACFLLRELQKAFAIFYAYHILFKPQKDRKSTRLN